MKVIGHDIFQVIGETIVILKSTNTPAGARKYYISHPDHVWLTGKAPARTNKYGYASIILHGESISQWIESHTPTAPTAQ